MEHTACCSHIYEHISMPVTGRATYMKTLYVYSEKVRGKNVTERIIEEGVNMF